MSGVHETVEGGIRLRESDLRNFSSTVGGRGRADSVLARASVQLPIIDLGNSMTKLRAKPHRQTTSFQLF